MILNTILATARRNMQIKNVTMKKRGFWAYISKLLDPRDHLTFSEVDLWPKSSVIESAYSYRGLDGWVTLDDRQYGGSSFSTFEFVESSDSDEKFIRFKGRLKFNSNIAKASKTTAGFCALRATSDKSVDLRDHRAVEIVLRSSCKMNYYLNFGCASWTVSGEDLYQIMFEVPAGEKWLTYHIPFNLFRLTVNGKVTEDQRENDSLQFKSIGILVTETAEADIVVDKEFCLDISHIKAIFAFDESLVHTSLVKR